MTCRETLEFLMNYLSGELPPEQRRIFDEHLAECPACVNYLRTYEETVKLGKAAFRESDELPCGMPEELVKAILASRPNEH